MFLQGIAEVLNCGVLETIVFQNKSSVSYCYFLIVAIWITYMKYIMTDLTLMLVKKCIEYESFCFIYSLFFFLKSLFKSHLENVEITILEHFWKVFHSVKKAEDMSEAKLRKNNFSGCSGEITANATNGLVLSPSPLVFPCLMKILKNVQFFKTSAILFH